MVVRRSARVWVCQCVRLWGVDGVGGGVLVGVGICVGAGERGWGEGGGGGGGGGVLGYVARQVD